MSMILPLARFGKERARVCWRKRPISLAKLVPTLPLKLNASSRRRGETVRQELSAIESVLAPTSWKSGVSLVFGAFLKILPDKPGIAAKLAARTPAEFNQHRPRLSTTNCLASSTALLGQEHQDWHVSQRGKSVGKQFSHP